MKHVSRLIFALLVFATLTSCQQEEKKTPPNIIFIMSDDHAEKAISAYGHNLLQTPNIDRIANEGILFENSFVTNSICAPSRAVMLTGKYSHLNGLRDNRDQFDGSQLTFPKLLQKAGYQTAMVGKWHLKTTPQGFDYWNILINQGDYYNPRMIDMGDTMTHTGYTTDLITDFALDYLENRDETKPFCMLFHHKAPHRNWMPPPRHFDLFKDKDIPMPDNFYDDYANRSVAAAEQDMHIDDMFLHLDMKLHPNDELPPSGTGGGPPGFTDVNAWANAYGRMNDEQKAAWDAHYDPINQDFLKRKPTGKELSEWKYRRYMEDYLGSVAAVDDNVGRVLDYLEEHGLEENTIVVYTSDQGFYLGEHGWYDKRWMYEESLSMPLVMKFPKEISAGQRNKDIVLNLDFAPTFLDYAGIEIPREMQGASLRQLAKNNMADDWRSSMYYEYFEFPHGWHSVKKHYGVRTDRYKLIHYHTDLDDWELFDLERDPSEMQNLYDHPDYKEVQKELHNELTKLRKELLVEEV